MKGALPAALLLLLVAGSALAGDSCSLMAPDPVLQPGAYPGQTLDKRSSHTSMETARPRPGLRIDIRQDGCEDFITTRFVLTVARGEARERTEDEWIDFARAEIGRLKTSAPRRFQELDAFLGKARGIAPRNGERTLCRDGSAADAGACSRDSLGGYTFSVRRGRRATTVSVTEYISA
jgi:hypothetical protein